MNKQFNTYFDSDRTRYVIHSATCQAQTRTRRGDWPLEIEKTVTGLQAAVDTVINAERAALGYDLKRSVKVHGCCGTKAEIKALSCPRADAKHRCPKCDNGYAVHGCSLDDGCFANK